MAALDFLTKKYGPLPGWGWAAAGAGVFLVYRLRKNSQAASTQAATSSGGVAPSGYTAPGGYGSPEPTASLSTPGGFSYSGPVGGLSNPTVSGLFANPTPAIAATSGATSNVPQVGAYSGSGYLPYNPGAISTGLTGGQFEYIGSPQALTTDIQQYGPSSIFTQTNPGIFSVSQGAGIQQQYLPGTPQYLRVPGT